MTANCFSTDADCGTLAVFDLGLLRHVPWRQATTAPGPRTPTFSGENACAMLLAIMKSFVQSLVTPKLAQRSVRRSFKRNAAQRSAARLRQNDETNKACCVGKLPTQPAPAPNLGVCRSSFSRSQQHQPARLAGAPRARAAFPPPCPRHQDQSKPPRERASSNFQLSFL